MKFSGTFLGIFMMYTSLWGQLPPAYKLFDGEGNPVEWERLMEAAQQSDVVFFGEQHNNPIAHWLRFRMVKDLHGMGGKRLIIGAEMFELDDQLKLDEYQQGLINERNFEQEARLWNNYKTDYKPLFDWSRQHDIYWYATNIPRRYANLVHREGLEALERLPEASRNYFPPLPIEVDIALETYNALLEMMPAGHGGENFVAAQAVKDAAMGYTVARIAADDKLVVHLNGSYHNEKREGILWYVEYYRPGLEMLAISTVEQDHLSVLNDEHRGKADFIIVVDHRMTKTY